MHRAAVVIGVDKLQGDFTPLSDASKGAKRVANWLTNEGYDVILFTDEQGTKAVTIREVQDAVETIVDSNKQYQHLVVYFAGHGISNDFAEVWLLSDAPSMGNEAINCHKSYYVGKQLSIPTITLIGDACRVAPNFTATTCDGSSIFKVPSVRSPIETYIDRFLSTSPGDPALEISLAEKNYRSVFTDAFLEAYEHPYEEMVKKVNLDGNQIDAVTNHGFKITSYLADQITDKLKKARIPKSQTPEVTVQSLEDVFIGRLLGNPIKAPKISYGGAGVNFLSTSTSPSGMLGGQTEIIERSVGLTTFDEYSDRISATDRQGSDHYETQTGFKVFGAKVKEFIALDMKGELLSRGTDDEPAYLRLTPGVPGIKNQNNDHCTVLIKFEDGSGTVLPGLIHYIGSVYVDNGCVVNVNYAPSANGPYWAMYNMERDRIEQFRSFVAAATRFGVFKVERRDANRLASQIRYMKTLDPTLGLYAAYAYQMAGKIDKVVDIMHYMEDTHRLKLFDIAMLTGASYEKLNKPYSPVVPAMPLLSQGWNYIQFFNPELAEQYKLVSQQRRQSLWTTFTPQGMDSLIILINKETTNETVTNSRPLPTG